MLTRLKVSGFKNLVDVDVRFGPFTCIAGANGVGKSNLFDAIGFLGALANRTLIDAAKSVREGRTADIRSLFHRVGDQYDETMSFEAEMIIPEKGTDDLGQEAIASITFLKYSINLALKKPKNGLSLGGLEIIKEELERINITESRNYLMFPYEDGWRKTTLKGRRTASFISTEKKVASQAQEGEASQTRIDLHQDRGESGGRKVSYLASALQRTALSSVNNAAEHRTAVLVRREMQSWRRLQLESSALREPDDFSTPPRLASSGAHLAATLYRLAQGEIDANAASPLASSDIYAKVANRLADLIDDVREVGVDVDPKRELLTLFAKGRDQTPHLARALSDGTLRFLALAVIELDPESQGVLCLEEPENGIHPSRIPAMLNLLQAIAVDADGPIGPDNPLRQVIVNTHSPIVVSAVPEDSLYFAELKETIRGPQRFQRVVFSCLDATWRVPTNETGVRPSIAAKGDILRYLSPVQAEEVPIESNGHSTSGTSLPRKSRRVSDRPDLQRLLRFGDDSE